MNLMDPELKAYLDEMKRDLATHVSQECGRVETNLLTHVANVEARLRDHVSQECEKVETKLLTEFHKWASPVEMRIRSHAAVMRALDLEQEALTDRMDKLERPGHGAS
jgi:ubiquinone biosynthesis protein UbiJ